jgi:FG-GAP-like repeat/Abnormal spindle-like microcephaly-assoc'd, ASPM-SPD-2-Hydin/FG-GAP repeat
MQNRQSVLVIIATVFLALGVASLNAQAQNPTPFIDSLSPVATAPGTGQDLQLTILGSGFASGATVNFNGTSLTPSSISNTQIAVTVPASSLATALTASVTVVNPNTAPLEGSSNIVFFPITNATPSVSNLAQTAFGVGIYPDSVAVGDFNGDGKLDLAVANQDGTVSILLGDGTGNFNPALSPAVGNMSDSVAVGDFNGDGKLDLAVANACGSEPGCSSGGTVSILLGDGTGKFNPTDSSPATGNWPDSVAVGDFNGDGKLDLAVANDYSNTVSILLGDGTGNFTAVRSPATGSAPQSVAVGDFNGDGKLDLAVVNSGDSTVSILLGDGKGNFNPTASSPATGSQPRGVAVGDFNGDGKLDLAVANSNSNTVSILLGDGTGNFTAASSPATGKDPRSLAVGDFNGDGKLDLAVATQGTNTVSILLGDGTGNFTAASSPASGNNPNSVAVGDFNGDGRLDLAVTNTGPNNTVSVLLQAAAPEASVPSSLAFGNQNLSSPKTLPLTITNTGTVALNITGTSVSGTNSADFTAALNTCSSSVNPGSNCSLSITFTPSLVGAESATLTVTDNAGSGTQTVSLTGTGVGVPNAGVSPPSLSFGNQLQGTTSPAQTVTLSNTGTGALAISSISTTGNFAETNTCRSSVAANGSCTISVTFTPQASGSLTGVLTITDNNGGTTGSTQTVTLSGTGTVPAAGVSPASLSFGNQLQGTTSAAQTVTLSNTGSAALTISSITPSGNFSISTNGCGSSLAQNSSCQIGITFTPQSTGALSGKLTITDNSNGVAGSTQAVSLSGTGTVPAASVSPASLSFGYQLQGTTSPAQTVTLSNTGTAALAISSITPSGNFSMSSNGCGSSLAQNSSCQIGITFTPQSTGALSGTLTIIDNSNGVAGSTQAVSLSGTGTNFSITATPASQTISSGHTATYSLTLGSISGFSGTVALGCSGGPPNSTCSVSPASFNLNGSGTGKATVSLSRPMNVNHGTFTLTFTASSGGVTHSTSVSLTVK